MATAATTAATTALFKSALDRIDAVAKGPAKTAFVKAVAALQSYAPYLAETNDRVSTFKTFADPTKPVSLLDHFVRTEFSTKNYRNGKKSEAKTINQDDILTKLIRPSRIVVSATAGFGKSMVMRYLFLRTLVALSQYFWSSVTSIGSQPRRIS